MGTPKDDAFRLLPFTFGLIPKQVVDIMCFRTSPEGCEQAALHSLFLCSKLLLSFGSCKAMSVQTDSVHTLPPFSSLLPFQWDMESLASLQEGKAPHICAEAAIFPSLLHTCNFKTNVTL